MYSYFLSENEARDITLAATDTGRGKYDLPCPEGLVILLHAMAGVSREVYPLLSHPDFHTNRAPAPVKAYSILATAAARVAKEYWVAQQAHAKALSGGCH